MRVVLTIAFEPSTGKCTVDGPIENKGVAYSLLEMARDVIKDHNDKKVLVVPPTGGLSP